MTAPIFLLAEDTLQQYAIESIERHLTEEEITRVRDVLSTSPALRRLIEAAIRVITSQA